MLRGEALDTEVLRLPSWEALVWRTQWGEQSLDSTTAPSDRQKRGVLRLSLAPAVPGGTEQVKRAEQPRELPGEGCRSRDCPSPGSTQRPSPALQH